MEARSRVQRCARLANVPWGLIVFVIGIAYGWLTPGRQSKRELFKKGLLWGLLVAAVMFLVGLFAPRFNPLGLGGMGVFGTIIAAIVLSLLFVLGVWLGDWLEGRGTTRAASRRV